MVSVAAIEDFTGGLNLRADVFNLGKNESPDMLNVDIDPRGGVQQRDGSSCVNSVDIGGISAANFAPHKLFHWRVVSPQLIVTANDKIFYATSNTFDVIQNGSSVDVATTNEYGAEFAEWIGSQPELYIACGEGTASHRWDGNVATALTPSGSGAWQDDLLSPTTGFMPTADHVASHVDRIWVAATDENGTSYPDRVRWSHPLFPESWRENDYIDVVGGGQGIRALVPFSNHILVFKDRAVFAIHGYNASTFQLVPLTQELGTYSSQTVAVSEQAVYFFSWPDGVFRYDGSSIVDVFQQLRPLIQSGEINKNALDAVHVDWMKRKVFVSLPVGVSPDDFQNYDGTQIAGGIYDDEEVKYDGYIRPPVATASFVFDPSVGKGGAWSRYRTADGHAMVGGVDFVFPDGITNGVYIHPYYPKVLKFDPALATDCVDDTDTVFDGYYTMGWQDLGQPQARKFWRSPEFIVSRVADEYQLNVDVFHDWNTFNFDRQFDVDFVSDASGTPDDIESWTENYGSDTVRGEALGSARAVQIRFGSSGAKWGVNGVVFRYSFRKVRV